MELAGLSLGGGRGAGRVHLASGERSGSARSSPDPVWVVDREDRSPSAPLDRTIRGIVFDEPPGAGEPSRRFAAVAGLPADLFREGEPVEVDGDRGVVVLEGVREIPVVTAFLRRDDGRILLLRRSARVGSFQGRWAGVSGFLEDPTAETQAYREIQEETGLARQDVELEVVGRLVYARDGATIYTVHPFRFCALRTEVRLDWEHTEAEWVDPTAIDESPTVPNLDRAWRSVAPPRLRKG